MFLGRMRGCAGPLGYGYITIFIKYNDALGGRPTGLMEAIVIPKNLDETEKLEDKTRLANVG